MKTLYIIHGWTYTIEPWRATVGYLREAGVKVVMLKVPGLTEESDKVWTIDKYVRWANQNLPEGCVVLGHSNGGRILLNLVNKYPKKVGHLILLNSAGVYKESKKSNFVGKVAVRFGFLKKFKLLRKVIQKLMGASDYSRAPKNMQETLKNMLASDKELKIGEQVVPTSILWGEEDRITKVEEGRIMHEKILGSNFRVVSGWEHAPYITHPKGLADEILKILRGAK